MFRQEPVSLKTEVKLSACLDPLPVRLPTSGVSPQQVRIEPRAVNSLEPQAIRTLIGDHHEPVKILLIEPPFHVQQIEEAFSHQHIVTERADQASYIDGLIPVDTARAQKEVAK